MEPAATTAVIDAYVVELAHSLRGPARLKADLLAEARDGLLDAAESYTTRGMRPEVAASRAVGEFGSVADIAPDYQVELGVAQGRRTALLILAVLAMQPVVWNIAPALLGAAPNGSPGRGYELLNRGVELLGAGAIAGSLLALLACGIGVRRLSARHRVARTIGLFAFTVVGVFTLGGLLLTVLGSTPAAPTLLGLPWTVTFLLVPLAAVAVSARRCLVAG